MFLKFWGAVLLLHPFILRASRHFIRVSGGPKKEPVQWLNDAILIEQLEIVRVGKDSFFALCLFISFLLFGRIQLPKYEKLTFIFIMSLSFFTCFDFLSPNVFYQSLFFGFGVLFIGHVYANYTPKLERGILFCIALSCVIQSIFTLIEVSGINLYHVYAEFSGLSVKPANMTKGPLGNSNLSAAYLAITLPTLIYTKKLRWLFFLPLISLYYLDSALGWVTVLLPGVCYVSRKYLPFVLLLATSATYLAFFQHLNLDSGRIDAWKVAFDNFGYFHITGEGLGFFADKMPTVHNMGGTVFRQFHNEILEAYLAFGVIGLGLLTYSFYRAYKYANILLSVTLFAILVNMTGNFTLHTSTIFTVCGFYYVFGLKRGHYVS